MTTDDLSILDAWNVGAPDSGTINRTLLVETAGGSYALRAYRYGERAPVEREHAVIAHVRGLGLPAVGPLPLPGGATMLERAGRFYALFPRAPGIQLRRDELALGDIAAIGGFLAGVHRALRSFPAAQAARRPSAINRAATLAGIDALDATIRARPTLDDVDHRAIERLVDRRAWIERSTDELLPDVSAIEQQTIHGDYQETNLFFQDGRVVAIIDWDQTYAAPRAWEVVRALHLVCRFALAPTASGCRSTRPSSTWSCAATG